MTVLATDTQRYSNVVKMEFCPEHGFCKKLVTYNGTAVATPIGTVLGKYIASPVGTAGALVGTVTGTIGTITMTSNKDLKLGTYKLFVYRAVSNAGDFVLIDPDGKVVGEGQIGTAFAQAGFAFTWADATDAVVGDYTTIVVTGTEKYKLVETSATDGTEVPSVVVVGDATGRPLSTTPVVNTDTTFLVMYRGPAYVADASLAFGASVTAGAVRTAYLAALTKASGIDVLTQI